MECKSIICTILFSIIHIRLDMKLSNFLISFRDYTAVEHTGSDVQMVSPKHSRYDSMDQLLPYNSAKKANKAKLSSRISPVDVEVRGPIGWLNTILEDNTLDMQECTTKNFVAILMDLLLYQHEELVNHAFGLLLLYFSQRHMLLNALLNVQLLENEESINALGALSDQLAILKTHSEKAEFWLGRKYEVGFTNPQVLEQYSTDSLTLATHNLVSDIIAGMINLCYKELAPSSDPMADDEPDFERTVWKSDSDKSKSFQFEGTSAPIYSTVIQNTDPQAMDPDIFSFSEVPSRSFQRLLRNLSVHEPILELIKFPCSELFFSAERLHTVLRFCFVFLAKFCRDNIQNQELLSNYVEYFIAAMPGCVFANTLVREIYQNNASLCRRLPIKHIRSLAKAIGDTPLSAKKCSIIRTLQIFIRVSGKLILRNQIEVMSQLSSYETEHFKSLYETPEAIAKLQSMSTAVIRQYVVNPLKTGSQGITVSLDIQYFIEMLGIMSLCCEDKNNQAEVTCQYLISLDKLMELLAAASLFWPLKQALLRFFYHVYLDVEDEVPESDECIWMVIKDLSSDLEYIYDNYTRSGKQYSASIETTKFNLVDRNLELAQSALFYVYETVIPCLRQIFLKRGSNLPVDWDSSELKGLVIRVCDFHRISPKIEFSRLSCDFLILMSEISSLQGYLDGISIPEILSSRDALNKIIKSPVKSALSTFEEGLKASELQHIVHELLESEEVQEAVDLEFAGIVQSFLDTEKLTEAAFGIEFKMDVKDLYRALVYLIDDNDLNLGDDKIVRGLRLLRRTIEIAVKGQRGPAADWDTDDWIDYKEEITKQQNILAEIGCVKMICSIITRPNLDVRCECILLSITLLLGGSQAAQQSFTTVLQEDLTNTFLIEIKNMLSTHFEKTRKEQMNKLHLSQKEAAEKSKLTTVQTDPEDSEEEFLLDGEIDFAQDEEFVLDKQHFTSYQVVINILRFLQLLCEGHYGVMQNHLREQVIAGVLHNKSVDFILLLDTYLGAYIKMLHRDNIKLGFQLLDILTEVVQGPCRDNQRILSQPKSIDQCKELLTCLKHSGDIELRGFKIPPMRRSALSNRKQ